MISIIQELAAKVILGPFDYLVGKVTHNKAVLSAEDIPFYELLIRNRSVFLNEYLDVAANKKLNNIRDFYKIKKDINEDNKWKAEPILLYSYLFSENAAKCPQTFEVIRKIPGCCAAMFSVLEPGKYIPPHKGIYRGIYRCLFTLQTGKDGNCWIRVNDIKLYFSEGSVIVFDETAVHEVKNDCGADRVALYLDIYRKLPFPLNVYNKFIYLLIKKSPFVQGILREYKKLQNSTVMPFTPADPVLK